VYSDEGVAGRGAYCDSSIDGGCCINPIGIDGEAAPGRGGSGFDANDGRSIAYILPLLLLPLLLLLVVVVSVLDDDGGIGGGGFLDSIEANADGSGRDGGANPHDACISEYALLLRSEVLDASAVEGYSGIVVIVLCCDGVGDSSDTDAGEA
jgi:hypothetical protein